MADDCLSDPDRTALIYAQTMCRSGQARSLRWDLRLSLAQVGAAVGVDAAVVSRWERRIRTPDRGPAIAYGRVLIELQSRGAAAVTDRLSA